MITDAISATRVCRILRNQGDAATVESDAIVAEEPLEITLQAAGAADAAPWMVSLWTPGDHRDFVTGLLFAESIIHRPGDILSLALDSPNKVTVSLPEACLRKAQPRHRSQASCGACGKTALAELGLEGLAPLDDFQDFSALSLSALAGVLSSRMTLFQQTGGNHAAALVNADGDLFCVQEDVGRHNAVDKSIGQALNDGLSLPEHALIVSSRLGFEIVQKTVRARIGLVLAMGAASSLAVELAEQMNVTLVGFLSETRYNIYTHPERLGRGD